MYHTDESRFSNKWPRKLMVRTKASYIIISMGHVNARQYVPENDTFNSLVVNVDTQNVCEQMVYNPAVLLLEN